MKFVVIEGLDGSGKSTQIKKVQMYFNRMKIPYKYLHFPRTDSPFYGELIARFLRGELGDINTVNPYLIALIYAGDRKDAADQIRKWLNEKYLVLADRYVHSNIAFQCAKLSDKNEIENLAEWIRKFEFDYNAIPKPDINLFLDVPFSFTEKSLRKNRKGNDRDYLKGNVDIHENDLDFQGRVREIYLKEIKNDPTFRLIDCTDGLESMLKPDDIFNKIITELKPVL